MKSYNSIHSFLVLISLLSITPKALAEFELKTKHNLEVAQLNKDDDKEEEFVLPELKGIPKDINEIAERITVRIDSPDGNGSGVIFAQDGDEYYVVTAKHVVEQDRIYEVVTEDDTVHEVEPEYITRFEDSDLAILSFESGKGYDVASFSDRGIGLNQESWVFVYGWAKAAEEPEPLFTVGKVVGKETGIFLVKDELSVNNTDGYELIYTNLSEKGVSGGPVLDTSGRVIGIHTSAEGERYRLKNLQLGFSLGIPIPTFLQSPELISVASSRNLQLSTIKEKADLVPFSRPDLNREELDSVGAILSPPPGANGSETQWVNYGNQLWRSAIYTEAVDAFDRAINKETNFHQAYYGKGLALYDLGKQSEASEAFAKAINLDPNFYPAWYRQSLTLINLKQYDRALETIDGAIALQPENTALYALRGDALQNLARYDEAIDAYNKAISTEENPLILTRRSSLYRILAQPDLAFSDLKHAIAADPRYTEGYINQGLAYFQVGNYQQALANFDHVLTIDRQDPRAYIGRGFTKHKLGDTTQAKADFNRAFQIYQQENQTDPEVKTVELQQNKYGQVATDFNYIMGLAADEGNISLGQGVISLLAQDEAQAVASFTKAKELFQTQQDDFSQRLTQQFLNEVQPQAFKSN